MHDPDAAVAGIEDGATVLIGGFGTAGQPIELVSLDDQNQPALTLENAKKLVDDPKVVALFLNRGTPHTQALQGLGETLLPDGTKAKDGAGFPGQFWTNALWLKK